MKNKWRLLKIFSTIIIFGLLMYFSLTRFNEKKMEDILVHFVSNDDEKVYFLDEKRVIDFVKSKNPSGKVGDIDIPYLEKEINHFPSVDSANVYLNLNGKLHIDIQQRIPKFRLSKGDMNYYVDGDAQEFPTSPHYAHDVMLVSGNVKRTEYQKLIELVDKIKNDTFSKKYYIGIVKEKENNYYLITQDGHFKVELGDLHQLDYKLSGFKKFMEKYLMYQDPRKYTKISLRFDNQIVTTLRKGYQPEENKKAE